MAGLNHPEVCSVQNVRLLQPGWGWWVGVEDEGLSESLNWGLKCLDKIPNYNFFEDKSLLYSCLHS